jgi:RNA polymerase sigma-70 factor (ECF subfamily)
MSKSNVKSELSLPENDWDWRGLQAVALREARRHVDAQRAEDVAQSALLRAWRYRANCRDPAAAGAWLAAIVKREAWRLAQGGDPQSDGGTLAEPRSDPTERLAAALDVRSAIETLPERDRVLIWLRYQRDLPVRELAAVLGTPVATAKVRLHRLRARLQQTLRSYAPDQEPLRDPLKTA